LLQVIGAPWYVNPPDKVTLPPGFVRTTSNAPVLAEAGVVIETAESEIWLIFVAATPPTVTPETPPKFEPLIVVEVPPALGPEVTESELIVGAGIGGASATQVPLANVTLGFPPVPTITPPAVPLPPGAALRKHNVESVSLY
jgi:hypothetical protein